MSVPASIFLQQPASGIAFQQGTTNLWPQPKAIVYAGLGRLASIQVWNSGSPSAGGARTGAVFHTPPSSLALGPSINSTTTVQAYCTSPTFGLVSGTIYTVSLWLKADASYGAISCGFAGSVTVLASTPSNPNVSGWQRISAVVQATATIAQQVKLISSSLVPGVNAPLWVDNVQIEAGASLTDYCDGSLGPSYKWVIAGATPTISTSGAGGTIAAGTYYAVQTAVTAAGETLASVGIAHIAASGGASTVTVTPVSMATQIASGSPTSYNIYTQAVGDTGWVKTTGGAVGTPIVFTTQAAISGGASGLPAADTSGLAPLPWNNISQRVGPSSVATTVGDITFFGNVTFAGAVQGINKPYLNVLDFGVLGNGVDDDGPAIQAVFNTAATLGRGVFFPAGTYIYKEQLTASCWILGESTGSTQLLYNGSSIAHGLKFYLTQVGGIDAPQNSGSIAGQAASSLVLTGTRVTAGIMNISVVGSVPSMSAARQDYPSGMMLIGNPWVQNVVTKSWDAGMIIHSTGGHWTINNLSSNGNWYGVYFIQDFADSMVFESDLTTNVFASCAWHSSAFEGAIWVRAHVGSGCYGWYEEFNSLNNPVDTLAHVQAAIAACATLWLSDARMLSCHFEACYAAAIYSEVAALDLYGSNPVLNGVAVGVYPANPGSNPNTAVNQNCVFEDMGHSWKSGNTYGRPADYAAVLGPISNHMYLGFLSTQPLGTMWVPTISHGSTIWAADPRFQDFICIGSGAAANAKFIRKDQQQRGLDQGTGTIALGTNNVVISTGADFGGVPQTLGTPGVPGVTGQVALVDIANGGNYTSAPTVVVNNTGTFGSGFAATTTLTGSAITGVTITNPGSGYVTPPLLTLSGGGGTGGGALVASLSPVGTQDLTGTCYSTGILPTVTPTSSAGNMGVPVMLVVSAVTCTAQTYSGRTPSTMAFSSTPTTTFTVTLINPSTGAAVNAVAAISFNWRIR